NRAKGVLNQACRIQGTGFLFASELVKDGWNYTTLTEDRSFCTDAVVQGYRITYCDEAVFYDEQPYKLRVALRQRLRWSKGHLQSAVENCPKLLKNMFKKDKCFTTTYDCFFLNFPRHVESVCRKVIVQVLEVIMAIMGGTVLAYFFNIKLGVNIKLFNFGFSYEWLNLFAEYAAQGALFGWLLGRIGSWLGSMFIEMLVLIVYRKKMEKSVGFKGVCRRIFHVFMFPFFDVIGKWTTYVAVFKKIEWKPIPHDTVMDISKLQADDEVQTVEETVEEETQLENA
ncbi:MAG: glycosyltransferase family 2 protein, partial [Clostridia bacterium]|nr:glycosyltransferase family 2 protein [Clostridia bacterium]